MGLSIVIVAVNPERPLSRNGGIKTKSDLLRGMRPDVAVATKHKLILSYNSIAPVLLNL